MHRVSNYTAKKILAVDDDPFIRKMFQSMLKSKGFAVYTAVDGAEAITKALQVNPDVIFLDIMMPEVDGFKALEILRTMEKTSEVPIIIVTARADSSTLLNAVKLGANDFIAKPFTRTMVMRKVRFALMSQDEKEDDETNEPNDTIDEDKKTFIQANTFQNMRNDCIGKFDIIFMALIKALSQRNKQNLLSILNKVSESCTTYSIDKPLSSIDELKASLKNEKWDTTMHQLEELYVIFRELQRSLESSPDVEDEQKTNEEKNNPDRWESPEKRQHGENTSDSFSESEQ